MNFYTGEGIVSNPHKFCSVTLNKCLLLSSIKGVAGLFSP